MNIQAALKKARETNKALKGKGWPKGLFVYHGIDNQLHWQDGKPFTFDVASLLSNKWITTKEGPYHLPEDLVHFLQ
ncbi:MAG: hypothetical protein M0R32_10500 [Candidatus Cloacimonetes bacterium]|jgi:hypothetical protein|nr:hypothetical protein [Candidatus Cloacimonadota bacterium]